MSGLFKSKKEELPAPRELTTPEQSQARSSLADYASKTNPSMALQSYSGKLSADPQAYESYIADVMNKYATRQPTSLYSAAEDQLQKTIGGQFDPATSDYYKAYRTEANRNLGEAQTQARQAANVGGMLRSTGRLNTENRLIQNTANDLNSVMAQLALQERQNQLNAIPQALNYSQFAEQQPLNTLAALMSAGGYQTGQQQSALDRLYGEWQRQATANQGGIDIYSMLANPNMYNYYQPQYSTQPSAFDQYVMPLAQTAMMMAAMSNPATAPLAAAGTVGNTGKTMSQILNFNTRQYM